MEIGEILETILSNLFFFGSLTFFVSVSLLRVTCGNSPATSWHNVIILLLVGSVLVLVLAEFFWPSWWLALLAMFFALANAAVRFFRSDRASGAHPIPA